MKKLLIIIFLLIPLFCSAQEQETNMSQTKYDKFTSKRGILFKKSDITLPRIIDEFGYTLDSKVRVFDAEGTRGYFYRIKANKKTISIDYDDLVEINKAIVALQSEYQSDLNRNTIEHIENYYVTLENFAVGYFLSDSSKSWFLKFNVYNEADVYLKNIEELANLFLDAQYLIEEIKKDGEVSQETKNRIRSIISQQNQVNKTPTRKKETSQWADDDIYRK